jgi:hypothetical protein
VPEAVARAFLAALDAMDWNTAAGAVHPEVAARFREQILEIARTLQPAGRKGDAQVDTVFPDPLRILGTATLADAEALSASQIVARWAEGLHPSRHGRWAPGDFSTVALTSPQESVRLARTLLEIVRDGTSVRAYYRTDWFVNELLSPHRGGSQVFKMEMKEDDWWVVDADLGGEGIAHLVIPEGMWKQLAR